MSPFALPSSPPPSPDLWVDSPTARWLLEGPAQLREGPHAGAIVGCIADHRRPTYAYPEISGYFLQWLAWRATRSGWSAALAGRAADAQRWLGIWLALHDPPRTRVHFDSGTDDWRNHAVFCFDVAMVLRGLASAADARLIEPDPLVVAGVVRQLERLILSDGVFAACVPHSGSAALPQRWSTRRGGFLAKAAAGVVGAARVLRDIPAHVARAADATFLASLRWDAWSPHTDVHPLLYTFEGAMSLPEHPRFGVVLPAIAARFDALLALVDTHGRLPESFDAGVPCCAPARVDIIAQTLRIGYLLAMHRAQRPSNQVALARLRHTLVRQVRPSGAVPFAMGHNISQWNVWTAMFTDQALNFDAGRNAPASLRTGDPLLV